jgi:AcrR family transcriptional regulator
MDEQVKRVYSSPLRARQADQTRREIVAAASKLFVSCGYTATTVEAIAAAAGVGRKTVFRSVGGKPECLKLAIDWAVTGDDVPVPLMERARIQAAMQAPDARWMLRDFAEHYAETAARSVPLLQVLAGAAGPDPTLRELHDEKERDHTFGMTNLAGHLDLRQALRDELTVTDAAQLLVAQTDGTIYHRLVIRHGWPTQRFADWLADTLTHQLIDPHYTVGPVPKTARATTPGIDLDARP